MIPNELGIFQPLKYVTGSLISSYWISSQNKIIKLSRKGFRGYVVHLPPERQIPQNSLLTDGRQPLPL